MPELAEVEFYRKQWNPGLGQAVRKVLLHPQARVFRDADPEAVTSHLPGSRFISSHAHGKQLCFRFSNDIWLGLHLGMSGRLCPARPEIIPDKHEHLVLVLDSTALVFSDYRMFGKVLFHKGQVILKEEAAKEGQVKNNKAQNKGQVNFEDTNKGQVILQDAPPWWRDLPPQPQDPAFDLPRLKALLKRYSRRPLKAFLLDQQGFPGIGNWMADEILWRARIHPAATGSSLSPKRQRQLFDQIKAVSEDAMRVIGSDWGTPPDSWLFNHRWKRGGICPVSGKPLLYETIGGRTTCFSPAIQK